MAQVRAILKYLTRIRRTSRMFLSTSMKERQSFGSFHSQDIEELIRIPEELYEPPKVRVSVQKRLLKDQEYDDAPTFGNTAKKNHFLLDEDWTFINHGAFGGALKMQLSESSLWRDECESQPLRFFDRHLLPMIAFAIREVAAFLNCSPTELLPLSNVTSGLNSVINSIILEKGDELMCLSLTYGSTKKIMKEACDRTGATLVNVHIPLPSATKDDIIARVTSQVSAHTKLIVIDQITSNTAITMPVIELAAKCKQINPNIIVLVDAAHSMFVHDISFRHEEESISSSCSSGKAPPPPLCLADVADIWLTNGHKWLCTSKGCAFMWVSPRMRGKLRPAIISHGFLPGGEESRGGGRSYAASNKMLSSFSWDGCRDYAALISAPSALEFWRNYNQNGTGLAQCREHNRRLLHEATELLKDEWKIKEEDFAAEKSLREDSPMSLVPLPYKFGNIDTRKNMTDKEAFGLQELLHHEYKIEVPIKCLEGRLYTRISAHIYNEIKDYEKLAGVLKKL